MKTKSKERVPADPAPYFDCPTLRARLCVNQCEAQRRRSDKFSVGYSACTKCGGYKTIPNVQLIPAAVVIAEAAASISTVSTASLIAKHRAQDQARRDKNGLR